MSETVKSAADKKADRMARLRELHNARNEARTQNHQEVIAEDARFKLPENWEARKVRAEWMVNDEKVRLNCSEKGQDYERMKLLTVSAIEAEKLDKKRKKKNPDPGFSDYEAQTARQYNRLVKSFPARDMVKYEQQKEKLGEAFYGAPHKVLHGLHKDTPNAINNMVQDIEKQIATRKKFSRRRTHNDDADIDYINEKNARFNKKLERYYGEHTTEIKQNLERGTAI